MRLPIGDQSRDQPDYRAAMPLRMMSMIALGSGGVSISRSNTQEASSSWAEARVSCGRSSPALTRVSK